MGDKIYLVKKDERSKEGKDAPWLMNYRPSGFKEIIGDGGLQEVYTFLWGSHRRDAKVFLDEREANRMAKTAGNCIVISAKKEAAP